MANVEQDWQTEDSTGALRQAAVNMQRTKDVIKGRVFTGPRFSKKVQHDGKVDELAEIIRMYRGIDAEEGDEEEEVKWVDSPRFDIAMCMVVLANILVIALETDLGGDETGYDRDGLWIFLEWVFCLIFFWEIYIKVQHHTRAWFRWDPWSWLCVVVAGMALLNVAVLSPLKVKGLRMLSLIRVINLLRLKKVIQRHKMLKELNLLLRSMLGSWLSLMWAMLVLMLILFVFSVWTTTLLGFSEGSQELQQETHGWDNEKLFGTIGKSMFTLVQVMTLDTWCSGVVRYVEVNKGFFVITFFIFISLTTYGVMNVIVSIIVEQTLHASQQSDGRVKQREDQAEASSKNGMKEIFLLADTESRGVLTMDEFAKACTSDPEVLWRLRQLELPVDDAKRLFQVMDGDGSTTLTMKEFVEGCTKIKGPARSKDLLALQHVADAMKIQMDFLAKELYDSELMIKRLDETTRRMTSRFGPTILNSRRAIQERVRGAAPTKPLPHQKAGSIDPGQLQAGNNPRLPDLPNLVN